MGGNRPDGLKLYNFTDNHDVERIISKLNDKSGFAPVHIMLYTLPGVPSIYYGSEFAIEGKKGYGAETDAPLRPELSYEEWLPKAKDSQYVKFISVLGDIRERVKELSYGDYKELMLTNRQYAYSRTYQNSCVIVMVNNDDKASVINVPANGEYSGALSGRKISANGNMSAEIPGNYGEIWIPQSDLEFEIPLIDVPAETRNEEKREDIAVEKVAEVDLNKPYDEMTVEELQQVIIGKMQKNGPVTERMKKDVTDNVHHNSLVTWAKSFRI